ncbi:MAG: hypothetical protein QOJ19_256 [Acidimicrobiia bacterium]|nr:hypothetical protein [Acidimicrobiia bacterium]
MVGEPELGEPELGEPEVGEPELGEPELGGVPAGTLQHGRRLAAAAGQALRRLCGDGVDVEVDRDAVTAHLLLPLVVAVATGTEVAAAPPQPWPVGDGYVCADLGAEGDRDAFVRLLESLGTDLPGAEELAVRAQEWRLPVTPYRRRAKVATAGCRSPDDIPGAPAMRGLPDVDLARPLEGVTVVDLTIMWAGPLCTSILAGLGARVLKVEPDCRLDGTRFSPGGWLYQALNREKVRVPLDLRAAGDRGAFFDVVAEADLVIDNFSPRVAPNLGIEPVDLQRVKRGVAVLALPAFPPGAQRHWVSYGTGVHAWSGLGDLGNGEMAAPTVTYPDPLAGLAGVGCALRLLAAGRRGASGALVGEVPLASVVGPLLEVPISDALRRAVDDRLVRRLARMFGPIPPCPLRMSTGSKA